MDSFSRVIGIGSWNGDDQAAWRLVERLKDRAKTAAEFVAMAEPSRLLDYVDDCHRLILIDSCLSGSSPGMVAA